MKNDNNESCANCAHSNNKGYKDLPAHAHLTWCKRFNQVCNLTDTDCIGFIASTALMDYYKNIEHQKRLKLSLGTQLDMFSKDFTP